MKPPLKTSVEKVGQPFVDDPVMARPLPITEAVAKTVNNEKSLRHDMLIGYERVILRWHKPNLSVNQKGK